MFVSRTWKLTAGPWHYYRDYAGFFYRSLLVYTNLVYLRAEKGVDHWGPWNFCRESIGLFNMSLLKVSFGLCYHREYITGLFYRSLLVYTNFVPESWHECRLRIRDVTTKNIIGIWYWSLWLCIGHFWCKQISYLRADTSVDHISLTLLQKKNGLWYRSLCVCIGLVYVLQCVTVYCSVLQRVAVCRSVLKVCCSVLQCMAVSCSVLQRVAVCLGLVYAS